MIESVEHLKPKLQSAIVEQSPPASITSVPLGDVVPTWDWYVSLDDARAFSQLSNLFAQKGKKVQLRGGRSVSLTDLRGRPCVLIGTFNNDWTLGLAGELRFYFDIDEQNGLLIVRDRQRPDITDWPYISGDSVSAPTQHTLDKHWGSTSPNISRVL